MEKYSDLKGNEIYLNKEQLEKYIEKLSIEQITELKSYKNTYPIINLKNDFQYITKVYEMLNENIKQGIIIHPAGEWLLDNYYIIEENVRVILNDLTLKKYVNLPGLVNGKYKGFARIYILANEIVKYTNNQIDREVIEKALEVYQKNKNITMEELWTLSIFLKLAIIQNIKDICEKIYVSQCQKIRANSILQDTIEVVEKKENIKVSSKFDLKNNSIDKIIPRNIYSQNVYSFIEYMAYSLKKYGKQGYPYIKVLKEIAEKKGISVEEIIKKEHFIVAVSKVSIGNAITSLKNVSRINFQEIFDNMNIVEEILKKDPLNIYSKMTYETKRYYRDVIEELSRKTKLSEVFISNKVIALAKNYYEENFHNKDNSFLFNNDNVEKYKKSHVGYYLIDKGKVELIKALNVNIKLRDLYNKKLLYIITFFSITMLLSVIIGILMLNFIKPIYAYILTLLIYIPITEIYLQIINYILIKKVKPKIIPKINMLDGVDEKNKTFIVIPTIINNPQKVDELLKKIEVFYLANKSLNIYFCVLGDCTTESEEYNKNDDLIIKYARNNIEKLNQKYEQNGKMKIFHFIYRKRRWIASEKKYLGWERKRGLLQQFNNYLINNMNILQNDEKFVEKDFILNTLENELIPEIKYVITLDGDTILPLNTALELIGAKAHILNFPVVKNNIVISRIWNYTT